MAQHTRSKGRQENGLWGREGEKKGVLYSTSSSITVVVVLSTNKSVGVHGYVLLPGLIVELLGPPSHSSKAADLRRHITVESFSSRKPFPTI